MNAQNWRRLSDRKSVDIEEALIDPAAHIHELYYKEDTYGKTKVPGQLMIVTYSPKFALYQKKIRDAQLQRAAKMVRDKSVKKQRRNPNYPSSIIKPIYQS